MADVLKKVKDYVCGEPRVFVNRHSGVVLPFRTAYDGCDYVEPVLVVYPASIVDSSQYESLPDMVAKFLRGEGTVRFAPSYEVADDADPEKAIAEMDPTRMPGFDLVDGSEAIRTAENELAAIESVKKQEADKLKEKAEADAKAKELAKAKKLEKLLEDAPHVSAGATGATHAPEK